MTVSGMGQLSITVSDLDASVRWYRDVLGLPHLFTVEGQPMAFLRTGERPAPDST
jgi:catechol 2,3-dioxygenase-like lactoylglutathione lyase family enzyme